MRKSTGKAKIVAYMVWRNLYKEKAGQGETCPVKERNMEVFSNDFAAVYFREKLCYDVLTEYGTISEGFQKIQCVHAPRIISIIKAMNARNEKRKSGRKRGEAQSGSAATPARPRRVLSGRGSLWSEAVEMACACLGARRRGAPRVTGRHQPPRQRSRRLV